MSKAYELGLYEKAMPGTLTWKERLEAAKAAGYDYVEISIDATEEKIEGRKSKSMRPEFRSGQCVSVHLPNMRSEAVMKHAVQEEWRSWKNHFSWQMILESVL